MEEIIATLPCSAEGAEEIVIEEGVTVIPDGLFRDCGVLKRVRLPRSVRRIGDGIFGRLSDIDVYYDGSAAEWRALTENIREERPVYHQGLYDHQPYNSGEGSYYTYEMTDIHFCGAITDLRVHTADGETVYYRPTVRVVDGVLEVPNTVTAIADGTVQDVELLVSARIPEWVTVIGYNAFAYARNLTEVYIPDTVTEIGGRAFFGCSALMRVRLPEGLKAIHANAFDRCGSLTELDLPEGVTVIGDYAFSGSGLRNITIPEGVRKLGRSAFSGCNALTEVKLPEGLSAIPEYAFSRCKALTAIDLPPSVKKIGFEAFYGAGLTEITVPEWVNALGDHAFAQCAKLKRVTLTGTRSIGERAFSGCASLEKIILATEKPLILGDSIFMGVPSPLSVEYGGASESIPGSFARHRSNSGGMSMTVMPLLHNHGSDFTVTVCCADGKEITLTGVATN